MSRPGNRKSEARDDQFERIEPIKLEAINGFRTRVKGLLTKWGVILGLSTAVGGASGIVAQQKYRSMTGYNPDKPAIIEEREPISEILDEGKAKEYLERAKEWTKKKIDNVGTKSKIVREYKETKKTVKETYSRLIEFGDKATFLSAFLIGFMAMVILAGKICEAKKALMQSVDPVLVKNLESMATKINEIGVRVSQLSDLANSGQPVTSEMIKEVKEAYDTATIGLENE